MKFRAMVVVCGFLLLGQCGLLSAGGWVQQRCHGRHQQALRLSPDNDLMNILCRVPYQEAMLPGFTEGNVCHVWHGGHGKNFKRYQVYCVNPNEKPVAWVNHGFGGHPHNAWAVGWSAKDVMQYVCRVNYRKQWYFGVVRTKTNGVCDTFGIKDTRDFHHYEVLVMRHQRYAHIWF